MKSHQNQDYNQVCRNTLLHFESVYRFGCNFSASSSFRLLQTKQCNFTTTNIVFTGGSFSILTINSYYNKLCEAKYCDFSMATRLIDCQSHWPNNWSARHSQRFKRKNRVDIAPLHFENWGRIPGMALLTFYNLKSVCIFSLLFSIHLLRCWQGEFV